MSVRLVSVEYLKLIYRAASRLNVYTAVSSLSYFHDKARAKGCIRMSGVRFNGLSGIIQGTFIISNRLASHIAKSPPRLLM